MCASGAWTCSARRCRTSERGGQHGSRGRILCGTRLLPLKIYCVYQSGATTDNKPGATTDNNPGPGPDNKPRPGPDAEPTSNVKLKDGDRKGSGGDPEVQNEDSRDGRTGERSGSGGSNAGTGGGGGSDGGGGETCATRVHAGAISLRSMVERSCRIATACVLKQGTQTSFAHREELPAHLFAAESLC